jgi:hypothetical protein
VLLGEPLNIPGVLSRGLLYSLSSSFTLNEYPPLNDVSPIHTSWGIIYFI